MLFGRLTERAQRVLAHAQEEAIRLNHSNIGTEHLLLGLMKEPEGIAAKVLESFNITEDKVIEEVEKLIGHGQDHVGTLHYTPRAKKSLNYRWMKLENYITILLNGTYFIRLDS